MEYLCCKPFPCVRNCKNYNLRPLSATNHHQLSTVFPNKNFSQCKRICCMCYLKLNAEYKKCRNAQAAEAEATALCEFQYEASSSTPAPEHERISPEMYDSSDSETNLENSELVDAINSSIIPHLPNNISPISKKRFQRSRSYKTSKTCNVAETLKTTLCAPELNEEPTSTTTKLEYYEAILHNMKFQFENGDYSTKLRILTLLPSSMTLKEIQHIFGDVATRYMIEISKGLQQKEKTFLSIKPSSTSRNALSTEIEQLVTDFYNNDEITRVMPGNKDSMLLHDGSERVTIQKRLLLCS